MVAWIQRWLQKCRPAEQKHERNDEHNKHCLAPRALIANDAVRCVNHKPDHAQSGCQPNCSILPIGFASACVLATCRTYNLEISNQICR
jgi:hypothetical protein